MNLEKYEYFKTDNGILYKGDNKEILKMFPDNYIDLVITSPPYDDARTYDGIVEWDFDIFKQVANLLYKKIKEGGVVCWNVNDKIKNFSRTMTSFKQAIYFTDIGFKMYDIIIWEKNYPFNHIDRYKNAWEFVFVLSKGKPKTINIIKDIKTKSGIIVKKNSTKRLKNGKLKKERNYVLKEYTSRSNVWYIPIGNNNSSKDKIAFKHPAIFPEKLANDLIISFSNENDIVLDPFMGSGTVSKMAEINKRKWIGIEINENYCEIIKQRINELYDNLFKQPLK